MANASDSKTPLMEGQQAGLSYAEANALMASDPAALHQGMQVPPQQGGFPGNTSQEAAAMLPAPPATPAGWRAIWDYAQGRYFFMSDAGAMSWELPAQAPMGSPIVGGYHQAPPVVGGYHQGYTKAQLGDDGGGGFCLPPPKAGATIKSKAAQLEETREMLSQPPIVKASTSKQIAFDLGLVPSKEGADYSDFKIVSKFVARTLADVSEGGGTQIKESVQLTGGVRSAEVSFWMHYLHETFEWKCFTARHSSHLAFCFHTLDSQDEGAKMFQDLANGPPAASGKKTVEQVKEEDEIAARAVERRHGRILDIDTRCVELSTGGQQVQPEMLSQLKRPLLMQPYAVLLLLCASCVPL